jgi:hypothetical protein
MWGEHEEGNRKGRSGVTAVKREPLEHPISKKRYQTKGGFRDRPSYHAVYPKKKKPKQPRHSGLVPADPMVCKMFENIQLAEQVRQENDGNITLAIKADRVKQMSFRQLIDYLIEIG